MSLHKLEQLVKPYAVYQAERAADEAFNAYEKQAQAEHKKSNRTHNQHLDELSPNRECSAAYDEVIEHFEQVKSNSLKASTYHGHRKSVFKGKFDILELAQLEFELNLLETFSEVNAMVVVLGKQKITDHLCRYYGDCMDYQILNVAYINRPNYCKFTIVVPYTTERAERVEIRSAITIESDITVQQRITDTKQKISAIYKRNDIK